MARSAERGTVPATEFGFGFFPRLFPRDGCAVYCILGYRADDELRELEELLRSIKYPAGKAPPPRRTTDRPKNNFGFSRPLILPSPARGEELRRSYFSVDPKPTPLGEGEAFRRRFLRTFLMVANLPRHFSRKRLASHRRSVILGASPYGRFLLKPRLPTVALPCRTPCNRRAAGFRAEALCALSSR